MTPCVKEVAASEMEQKPAERYEPASPRSGMLTRSGEKCRDLETEISSLEENLEVLDVGKRSSMLYVPALLLTTLKELTEEQLKTFQSHLTRGWTLVFPLIPDSQLKNTNRQDTVDQMVKGYGPEGAVRNTVMFLRRMKLDDLPEKLQRDHSAGTATSSYKLFDQPRHRPIFSPMEPEYHHHSFSSSLFQPGSSKELLSLTSAGSSGQLSLQEVAASGKERKPAGEESEEPSSELPSPSSGMLTRSGEKCRDLETVISRLEGNLEVLNVGKRTSMLDVLLLTTLEELTEEQLKTFQSCLTSGWMLGFPLIPEKQLKNSDRQETVDQMVKRYGPERAVRNTLRILMWMKLDDLAEQLQRDYSGVLLLTTLEELTEEQLKTFQSHLTIGWMLGFPPIPESQLENSDRQDTVDQMVERYGPERAVKITWRILMCMDLDDLAEQLERDYSGGIPTAPYQSFFQPRPFYGAIHPLLSSSPSFLLSLTSAGSSGQLSSQRPSMLAVPALLLTTLKELTEEQLKTFQSHLTRGQLPDCPPIPERQLENTNRQDTVDQMVKGYGPEGAVRNTVMFLRRMKLDDLPEKLQRDYSAALLLNSLEELNINELKTFQNYLTRGKLLGFPPIPKRQLRNTDRQVTVDLMMKSYGPERAVKITLRILRWMNEHDLTEKLQSDHTETAGPEEAVEITPEILKKMNWDDLSEKKKREWFPENYDQEDNGTYRFQCPRAGLFQCSITGLVFRMEGEGEVLYSTVSWNRRLLAKNDKRPAGPLFKFTCLKGSVCQLHLPHCEICPGGGCDFLSVGHVTNDHNIEFIPPHEITETHVIINITGFCDYGLTKDKDAPMSPINGLVLLFFKPSNDLYVLLLPKNVVLDEVEKKWKDRGAVLNLTPPDCELTPNQTYSLSGDPVRRIQPETSKFVNFKEYENYTAAFELKLQAEYINLTVIKAGLLSKLLNLFWISNCVWKCIVEFQDVRLFSTAIPQGGAKSNCLETRRCVSLLNTLEKLDQSDLKTFQFHLTHDVDGPISRSQLEDADRLVTVDRMVQSYCDEGAVKITLEILREMGQNKLADELENN
ncbi:uncharacterized protein ACWYII_004093 isoform 1-T1 [Salvelinus alpinus]